mmetsp:Transcript_17031/g.25780  ORF Transcript_17031/g.25780 Transcript_17031/m.25780 type:complete len:269 (+) Transcript_17031:440-1246(+)|eukprot:CAMPEP_0178917476 /NCGR_PEP_ID=MMETSP0786-20121207/13269_1 /TAXON_ID=186022 /ORGANISM="Thalassionema frauenfeldii, Strain CCMP 1798" /LENGTH=268 /DNA_ID=CAMNT_0020591033 /DNA_START=418 /DNA_END=1224 /DNA_ORIENTATION=+
MSFFAAAKLAAVFASQQENGEKELEEFWNTLDSSADGKVSGKEWGSKVYENKEIMSKYFGGSTLSEIGHAFNRIDSNNDGSLTWEEFSSEVKSYAASVKLAEAMKTDEGYADLKALWDTLDKDGDDKVTSKEWGNGVYANQDIMRKYFGGLELREIGLAFNRIDTDGNGSLTWTEFCDETKTYGAVLSLSQAIKEEPSALKELFDTLDKDADGKISGKEWGSAVYKNQHMMQKYFGGNTLEEIGKTFNRLDVNKSDNLTWDEFVRAVS